MRSKSKPVKMVDHATKQTGQDVNKRTVEDVKKRKTKRKRKPDRFILDQQGDSRPAKVSSSSKTRPEDTLGHDPLREKERDLVADLFGDDGEPQDTAETLLAGQEEAEQVEVKAKPGQQQGEQPPTIPHDPFDVHQPDEPKQRRPAWTDEDDQAIRVRDVVAGMDRARGSRGIREESEEQYSHTLQQKFSQTVGGSPDWARLHQPGAEQDTEEGGLVKGTGDYLAHGRSVKLDKKRLDFKKQLDLNYASRTEGSIISAAEFNPKHHVALVAGFSGDVVGAVSLFKYAKFLCDGRRFVAGSNKCNYFYMYDLEAAQQTRIPSNLGRDGHNMKDVLVSPDEELLVFVGKNGQLHLFDGGCLSHVDTLHASGDVTAATFNSSGSRMYTHTKGDVCVWDMNARTCIHRFYDDGCIGGTSIAVSPNNQYLACGSSSGVVNVYDLASATSPSPAPVKVMTRLRTSVSALLFNSSSEILASASDLVQNAIKLAHLPSMTYFENFPDPSADLRRIHVINFSPQSGYLAVGMGCKPLPNQSMSGYYWSPWPGTQNPL
ncbi:U3 small nucleolar RNA-associated protein 18 [Chionoecetes opilio]|uniref:U3 small nucleolar RNA-associated protein 18 n=1 Tax=Chionoecetes opilio TaxID=41210 RepID=A0A8J4YNS8_CHIOP|nr:U3 small nucleolar RNA-associated protein 18 [Chionoecetes opilio]